MAQFTFPVADLSKVTLERNVWSNCELSRKTSFRYGRDVKPIAYHQCGYQRRWQQGPSDDRRDTGVRDLTLWETYSYMPGRCFVEEVFSPCVEGTDWTQSPCDPSTPHVSTLMTAEATSVCGQCKTFDVGERRLHVLPTKCQQ